MCVKLAKQFLSVEQLRCKDRTTSDFVLKLSSSQSEKPRRRQCCTSGRHLLIAAWRYRLHVFPFFLFVHVTHSNIDTNSNSRDEDDNSNAVRSELWTLCSKLEVIRQHSEAYFGHTTTSWCIHWWSRPGAVGAIEVARSWSLSIAVVLVARAAVATGRVVMWTHRAPSFVCLVQLTSKWLQQSETWDWVKGERERERREMKSKSKRKRKKLASRWPLEAGLLNLGCRRAEKKICRRPAWVWRAFCSVLFSSNSIYLSFSLSASRSLGNTLLYEKHSNRDWNWNSALELSCKLWGVYLWLQL